LEHLGFRSPTSHLLNTYTYGTVVVISRDRPTDRQTELLTQRSKKRLAQNSGTALVFYSIILRSIDLVRPANKRPTTTQLISSSRLYRRQPVNSPVDAAASRIKLLLILLEMLEVVLLMMELRLNTAQQSA